MRINYCVYLLLFIAVNPVRAQGIAEFSYPSGRQAVSYSGLAASDQRVPSISLAVQAGIAQSFLDLTGDVIVSSEGRLSPVVSVSLFRARAGFGFQTGVGFTTHFFDVETTSSTDRTFKLAYLDLPLMARYNFSPAFSLSAGASLAFAVGAEADFDFATGRPEDEMRSKHDTVKNSISNVRVCSSYTFPFGLTIQAGYSRATGEILKDGAAGKQFGYVDVQVGYIIFGNNTGYRANDRLRNAGPKNG